MQIKKLCRSGTRYYYRGWAKDAETQFNVSKTTIYDWHNTPTRSFRHSQNKKMLASYLEKQCDNLGVTYIDEINY
jgi:hypothetical protein